MTRGFYLCLAASAFLSLGSACSSGGSSGDDDDDGGSSGAPAAGTERGECRNGGLCDDGLTCASDICVRIEGTGGTSGGTGGAVTGGGSGGSGGSTSGKGGTGGGKGGTGGASGGAGGTSGTGGVSPMGGTSQGTGGNVPQIISLLSNVSTITEGESVTFTAIVTDADGISDVIGGTLTSEDGTAAYGAFATGDQEGSYELVLSWAQMHQVTPIEFDAPTMRNLVASFFDQAGHSVTKALAVTLTCGDIQACDGACVDKSTNVDNCGACGHWCAGSTRDNADCNLGKCQIGAGDCIEADDGVFANCEEYCTSVDLVCATSSQGYTMTYEESSGCVSYTACGMTGAVMDPCSTPFRFGERNLRCSDPVTSVRCYCSDP